MALDDVSAHWLPVNPSKRWTELFFLAYGVVWISYVAIIVAFRLYEGLSKWGYIWVGIHVASPCILLPALLNPRADRDKPLGQRYWLKANLWIAIFSCIANYFGTHYFYQVLGASYTLQTYDINQVPIVMFLMTQAYFCLYHTLSNMLIRQVRSRLAPLGKWAQNVGEAVAVFLFAYFAAYTETYTIEAYPHYTFVDRKPMYTIGALFYALYFLVSFPVYFRLDEDVSAKKWSLGETAVSALASGMATMFLLDFWRLALGPVVHVSPELKAHGPPWLMATRNSRYA